MASQIALQMYTLREFTKTPADIAKTLQRVKKLGYDAIQSSAMGPIDPKELAQILKDNDLKCVATHISKDRMRDNTQQVIDEHKLWGCEYTAIGGFFPKEAFTKALWQNFADEYNAIAAKFAGSGVSIGYHNHSHELARIEDAPTTPLAMLVEKLSRDVWFEIDTYWIAHGGADPIAWINKVAGRIPCVHLKDMAIKPSREHYMAEIGVGNLNWSGILETCRKVGVKWYIVEQDTCYRDPFDSVETSLKNLKDMGLV
jgi:sugar phosphate isomerase/epimerase